MFWDLGVVVFFLIEVVLKVSNCTVLVYYISPNNGQANTCITIIIVQIFGLVGNL